MRIILTSAKVIPDSQPLTLLNDTMIHSLMSFESIEGFAVDFCFLLNPVRLITVHEGSRSIFGTVCRRYGFSTPRRKRSMQPNLLLLRVYDEESAFFYSPANNTIMKPNSGRQQLIALSRIGFTV